MPHPKKNKRSHDMSTKTNERELGLQGAAYDELVAVLPHVLESGPVVSPVRNVWLTFKNESISASAIMGLRASTEIVMTVMSSEHDDQFVLEQYWNDPPGLFALQETSRGRRASRALLAIIEGPLNSSIPSEKHDAIKAITHALLVALNITKGDLGNVASCTSRLTGDGDVELQTRIVPPLLATELRGLQGVMEQFGVKNVRLAPRNRMIMMALRL